MQVSGFNAELGRQQFLELLVTQLQYQDPLEPVGQEEFIQQLAQFSVVEGVEQLNLQFEDFLKLQTFSQVTDFVGQHVEFESPQSGELQRGQVQEARVINGELNLLIDSQQVPLSAIQAVVTPDA